MGFTPPKLPRARWILHFQAQFWRSLMSIGMLLHKLAPPRPPHADWTQQIPSTISGKPGIITLHFYVPHSYTSQKTLYANKPSFGAGDGGLDGLDRSGSLMERGRNKVREIGDHIRRRSNSGRRWGNYPVVINFHGGGFTLGHATDDARWCGTVVDECNAVVVSVDYRLAPECPFPTPIDDGVDAVLWIHEHAEELGIDKDNIALSGFSSGGNMAFTVPLRLYDELTGFKRDDDNDIDLERQETNPFRDSSSDPGKTPQITSSPVTQEPEVTPLETGGQSSAHPTSPHVSKPSKSNTLTTITSLPGERRKQLPNVRIRCIVPWYPSTDYTRTREQRRATCVRKDQELPSLFTDLFDESYLHPPQKVNLDSPYLSPGVAHTDLLTHALPNDIILHTCEWDMLLDEGEAFRKRLVEECNKTVYYKLIPGVPHGWDKAPNPWKPTPGVREHYLRACKEMRTLFGATPGVGMLTEHQTADGPSAAPRGSVQVVR